MPRLCCASFARPPKGKISPDRFGDWRGKLAAIERKKRTEEGEDSNETPIHPLRLCRELREVLDRDTILVVDGQEILNYARRAIPTYVLGNRLNSGPFGTMGVGLPFGVGAKAAQPDKKVVVLHGDGSFGLNCDGARHRRPPSAAGPCRRQPERRLDRRSRAQEARPRSRLHALRQECGEALGCHGEYVERPEDIRPALARRSRRPEAAPALVNVVTDWRARADTVRFTAYTT